VGIGFLWNRSRPLRRIFSIHSGSLFFAEMSSTTARESPRLAAAPAASLSDQPNLYLPSPSSSGRAVLVMRMSSWRRGWRLCCRPRVALRCR
jgi:hypothetical protein